ncbi:MAG: hypothetical protein Q4F78_06260 [Bacillota bacterium]|nr:hypothetical protein [Bacillota bacterium]
MTDCRRELEYFNIDKSYGGNQRWMRDWWMHIGGCAALTTCDVLIYCALHRGKPELYPYDLKDLNRKDYKKFGMFMKLYLQPRKGGIKELDTFINGVKLYLEDSDAEYIKLRALAGTESFETARESIKAQLDSGMPAAYLMLKHKDKKFDFFEWHWFVVNGYEENKDGFYIKAATYGAAHWLKLDELWDTGFDEKGGVVFFENV